TGQTVVNLRGHLDDVRGVAFSPDGTRLVSAGADWRIKIWEPGSGQEILTLRGELGGVNAVAFSPDGRHLATASCDGIVLVRDGRPAAERPMQPPGECVRFFAAIRSRRGWGVRWRRSSAGCDS